MTQEKYDDIKFNKEPMLDFKPGFSHLTIGDWNFGFRYYPDGPRICMKSTHYEDKAFLELNPIKDSARKAIEITACSGFVHNKNITLSQAISKDERSSACLPFSFLNDHQNKFLKGVVEYLGETHAQYQETLQDYEQRLFRLGMREAGIVLDEKGNIAKYKSPAELLAKSNWRDVD